MPHNKKSKRLGLLRQHGEETKVDEASASLGKIPAGLEILQSEPPTLSEKFLCVEKCHSIETPRNEPGRMLHTEVIRHNSNSMNGKRSLLRCGCVFKAESRTSSFSDANMPFNVTETHGAQLYKMPTTEPRCRAKSPSPLE